MRFFTLKWSEKYGPEYVNRLNRSIRDYGSLTCITDDPTGIDSEIEIVDYDTFDPFDEPKDRIFTREKLILFDRYRTGRNVWLDLDILIHGDIGKMIDIPWKLDRPKFIWNYWHPRKRSYDWYGKMSSCHVNSSFVMWDDDCGVPIYEYLIKHREEAFFTYKSLDKFLFYQCHRKNMLDYWNEGLFSSYNVEGFQRKGEVTLFNTSHVTKNHGIYQPAYELHEAPGWVNEIWTRR
jgi:hypothetical protein